MGREDISWAVERIAAAWAAQGLATAIVVVDRRHDGFSFGNQGWPSWATSPVPEAVARWRRLRLTPPPGELWSLEVRPDGEALADALVHARHAYDRVLLVGKSLRHRECDPAGRLVDAHVVVHSAGPYKRGFSRPASAGQCAGEVVLTPAESAVQWHQEHLRGWIPERPLTGVLLVGGAEKEVSLDEFDVAVEEQLIRFGVLILGRFPDHGWIIHGATHSPHPPTVLDPQPGQPTHAAMVSAAEALAQRLWPGASPVLGTSS